MHLPLRFQKQKLHLFKARAFQEGPLQREDPDVESQPEVLPPEIQDLDLPFDIDDNCYLYHIRHGKKHLAQTFKTEKREQALPLAEPQAEK